MRKIVLSMHTTLNGRLDDPFAWFTGVSDDLYADIGRAYDSFDTILVGRVTYREMVAYWPAAETDATGSDLSRRLARRMNTYRKIVYTTGSADDDLTWTNAELVTAASDDDLARHVRDLAAGPGGDIHLSGGSRLARTFARLGLLDEYRFFVHPVVSPGAAWFSEITGQRVLVPVSAVTYDNGVVGLSYRPDRPDHP